MSSLPMGGLPHPPRTPSQQKPSPQVCGLPQPQPGLRRAVTQPQGAGSHCPSQAFLSCCPGEPWPQHSHRMGMATAMWLLPCLSLRWPPVGHPQVLAEQPGRWLHPCPWAVLAGGEPASTVPICAQGGRTLWGCDVFCNKDRWFCAGCDSHRQPGVGCRGQRGRAARAGGTGVGGGQAWGWCSCPVPHALNASRPGGTSRAQSGWPWPA